MSHVVTLVPTPALRPTRARPLERAFEHSLLSQFATEQSAARAQQAFARERMQGLGSPQARQWQRALERARAAAVAQHGAPSASTAASFEFEVLFSV